MTKNSKISKIILYFTLGTIFLTSVLLKITLSKDIIDNQRDYTASGGEIVVILDKEVVGEELQALTASFSTPVEVVRHIGNYALLFIEDSAKYQSVLKGLRKNPKVAAAQANSTISTMGFSNDTYADTQWAIDNQGHYIYLTEAGREEKTAIENVDMDVVEAWRLFDEGQHEKREVVVAIIDTGVDYSHPDLAEHMWINKEEILGDGIDNDNNGYIDDIYGWDFYNNDSSVCHYKYYPETDKYLSSPKDNDDHGTHVAGIIGAVANNEIGVAGVASNIDIKIMVLKINGGSGGTGNISSAIEAVKYATMMGADICNMSWGTSEYTEALFQIMKESDMLYVAAAGNSGINNNDTPIYPASLGLDNLISVTFINSAGQLTDLSNYGTSSIDLAAPGEDIFSTTVGSYASMSGSSMAAPQVTSVAAMLYAYSENLYPSNVRDILINNMKPLKNLEGFIKNPGIPSAYMAEIASESLLRDTTPPELSFETIYNKNKMIIPVDVEDQGGSNIRVLRWIIGEKGAEDFRRGISGSVVKDNQISVTKAGIYTFYAADYAGNETIETYEVMEDKTTPKVNSYFTVAGSYKSRTITIKVSDSQSGIKKAEYLQGKKVAADFLPADAGTQINLKNGKGSFKVKKDGIYTIYATDNRGNNTAKQIQVTTVKATDIKLARSKVTLNENDEYTIRAYIKPVNTTDRITYTSSDKTIATVTSSGVVKALKERKVYISARASSGIKAVCQITINNNN